MVYNALCQRYGDAINPWADLITMAKAWCIVKKGGLSLVGVPSQFNGVSGFGSIAFNAHRLYGRIQLSHLFANWKQGKASTLFLILYHALLNV